MVMDSSMLMPACSMCWVSTLRYLVSVILLQLDAAPRHPFSVRVYTVSGECVANRQLDGGAIDYHLSLSLPHAVYVVQVDSDEPGLKGSQLLRF